MWWKRKYIFLTVCIQLLFLTFFSYGTAAKAKNAVNEGFIIEAERVVGSGMTASIVRQETSASDQKPMLRFHYKSAVIYGMKLTKQLESSKGPVTITLKAKGPVTVKGMTVDTTAISFKGACVKASEIVPELGMENVVMNAHFMESENSIIEQLVMGTVAGKQGPPHPDQSKLLQDLSTLPMNQLNKEIEKISKGHLPLTCEDGTTGAEPSGNIGEVTGTLPDVVGEVTKPLDPVLEPLKPVLDQLDPVLKPLEPVLKPLEPVLKPLDPVTKPLEPVLKPVEPVVTETTEKVDQVVHNVCVELENAKGVITKDLALSLIDEAISKKSPLSTICQKDTTFTKELQNWEKSLLSSLGLLNLLGKVITEDPVQQLNKMREKIAKEKDETIIFKP
ncbi:hypothetical protein QE429_004261 [Bacillus sp. SORGH_AS 510]|uniref:hypothetical protein n=1 Tax=Bacillus sp. SORGH_AS_0510 TaxID=3041771 RepID=UPI002781EC4D|nr:hypothetical protein [Bacillus sp. SORGH_AS_0510]MDQ1147434.1 hypothetical protein [Bacillus sp. SORGH_AS_0510]